MNTDSSLQPPATFIARFLRMEGSAGLLLMISTALALVLANSSAAPTYQALRSAHLGLSLLHWVNDGLMAVFFLLIGLEIKRELLVGELRSLKRAALPAIAAFGGMVLPALIYVATNWQSPASLRGWGIPAATDIAFALGILALLGRRVPVSLKVFLTALAILDDLGAILIIALFYTAEVSWLALASAGAGLAALVALNRFGVRHLGPFLIVGAFVWSAVLLSGIHATLAGVAVAALIPIHGADEVGERSPLYRLEKALHPYVAFGILPIFALFNAGLSFDGVSMMALLAPVPLGIASGLFVGKQVGVMAAAWIGVKAGWAEWPESATPLQVYGIALLCGIGFTMSLFIGGLAFDSSEMQDEVKLGVFCGSLLAALSGVLVLAFAGSRTVRAG